jgi:hypothetical protein
MKTPPFLIFATLLFWGWQSDLLLVGAVLGVVLESSRFMNWRWELDDTDFNRIWSFCVALVGYVFTTNDAGGGLSGLLHGNAARNAANSGVVTAIRFMRWLPMTTFPFVAAQMFNVRPSVPLTAISMVLRWRRSKGDPAFAGRYFSISYLYFIVCLFWDKLLGAGARGGDWAGISRPVRHQRGATGHPEFQRELDGAFFCAQNRRDAKHDLDGRHRGFEIVRENCHPAATENCGRSAGLSARSQLSDL